MPGGRINIDGKLEPWKHDPTREILPPEPNYSKDAQKFKKKIKAKNKVKEGKKKEKIIKKVGRGQSKFIIKDLNFIIPYSSYKGQALGYVLKMDSEFVRNLIKSGHYDISNEVIKLLKKRGIIKGA